MQAGNRIRIAAQSSIDVRARKRYRQTAWWCGDDTASAGIECDMDPPQQDSMSSRCSHDYDYDGRVVVRDLRV
jgi:hypothetical protein